MYLKWLLLCYNWTSLKIHHKSFVKHLYMALMLSRYSVFLNMFILRTVLQVKKKKNLKIRSLSKLWSINKSFWIIPVLPHWTIPELFWRLPHRNIVRQNFPLSLGHGTGYSKSHKTIITLHTHRAKLWAVIWPQYYSDM